MTQCNNAEIKTFANSPSWTVKPLSQQISEDKRSCISDELKNRGLEEQELAEKGLTELQD